MSKTITCEECHKERTGLQLAWEGVRYFRVEGKIICEHCKNMKIYATTEKAYCHVCGNDPSRECDCQFMLDLVKEVSNK